MIARERLADHIADLAWGRRNWQGISEVLLPLLFEEGGTA